MFWKSMAPVEAEHIVAGFAFELGKVEEGEIRERTVEQINLIDHDLATRVAQKLGLAVPDEQPVDDTMPASPALSQLNTGNGGIESRKIAVLAAGGVDVAGTQRFIEAMRQRGAVAEVLAPVAGGLLAGGSGGEIAVDRVITTVASVLYDAVVVPCGPAAVHRLDRRRLRTALRHRGLQASQSGGSGRGRYQAGAHGRHHRADRRRRRRHHIAWCGDDAGRRRRFGR